LPIAVPPSVTMFSMYSSLSTFSVAPSFSKGGTGVRFERFEGPAGAASAWHQTHCW
jgi:hypothetical protein